MVYDAWTGFDQSRKLMLGLDASRDGVGGRWVLDLLDYGSVDCSLSSCYSGVMEGERRLLTCQRSIAYHLEVDYIQP